MSFWSRREISVPTRVPSPFALSIAMLCSFLGFLLQIAASFSVWLRIEDVVYNGFLTTLTLSPIALCPGSLHPYIPPACMPWATSTTRLDRFGNCCSTYTTFRAMLGLMVLAFLLSLFCVITLGMAIWKRDDPRHMTVIKVVGVIQIVCGLCAALSVAMFFTTGAINKSNWNYVTLIQGSKSTVTAGAGLAGLSFLLFESAAVPLLLWSKLGHLACGRKCQEIRQPPPPPEDDDEYDEEEGEIETVPHGSQLRGSNFRFGTPTSPAKRAAIVPLDSMATTITGMDAMSGKDEM